MEDHFDPKKYKLLVKLIMPLFALVMIGLFVALPIWVMNTALTKEAQEKGRDVPRVINIDLIP